MNTQDIINETKRIKQSMRYDPEKKVVYISINKKDDHCFKVYDDYD